MVFALRLAISALILILFEWTVYKLFALKGLKYDRVLSKNTVYEGEELELKEIIENRKPLPMGWLVAEIGLGEHIEIVDRPGVYIKFKEYCRSVFSIMPYSTVTRHNRIVCKKRGEYSLNSVYLITADILGLASSISKHFEVDAKLLVYPTPAKLEDLSLPCHGWMGDIIVRRFVLEDPFLIAGTREYRDGDPLNRISWKATARTGELQAYKCDFSAQSHFIMMLNVEISPNQYSSADDNGKALIEYSIKCCTAFAERAVDTGINVGLVTNAYAIDGNPTEEVELASGMRQYYSILTTLARVDYRYYKSLYKMLSDKVAECVRGMDILVVTMFSDEIVLEHVNQLRRLGNNVEILLIGKEATRI